MLDSEKPLVCLGEAEVDILLKKSKRTSGLWGWFGGTCTALVLTLAPLAFADFLHAPSQKEIEASKSQSAANDFRDRTEGVQGNQGFIDRLQSAAISQRAAVRKIEDAILSNDPNSAVHALLYGTAEGSGYEEKLSVYLRTVDEIDRAVAQASIEFNKTELASFHQYRQLLTDVAQNNYDCLSKLAQSYSGSTGVQYSDLKCRQESPRDTKRYYALRDRLDLLDSCETAVGHYLDTVSGKLSAESELKMNQANLYSLHSLFSRAFSVLSGSQETQQLSAEDWTGINIELDQNCINNVKNRSFRREDERLAALYPQFDPNLHPTPLPNPEPGPVTPSPPSNIVMSALESSEPEKWNDSRRDISGYVIASTPQTYSGGQICKKYYYTVDEGDKHWSSTPSMACKSQNGAWQINTQTPT